MTALGSVGPVVGALRVVRRYDLPSRSDLDGRSDSTEATSVTMHVELRAGEPFVRLRLDWQNVSRDHRLRLHVPTAEPAVVSHAQGQLAVVERGRTAEAGPVGEYPLPTFPAESFVDAGGVAVLLGRTVEYEIVDAARVNRRHGARGDAAAVDRLPEPQRQSLPQRAGRAAAADARRAGPGTVSHVPGGHAASGVVGRSRSHRCERGVPAPGGRDARCRQRDHSPAVGRGSATRGRGRAARLTATPGRRGHRRRGARRQLVRSRDGRRRRVERRAGALRSHRRRTWHRRRAARGEPTDSCESRCVPGRSPPPGSTSTHPLDPDPTPSPPAPLSPNRKGDPSLRA